MQRRKHSLEFHQQDDSGHRHLSSLLNRHSRARSLKPVAWDGRWSSCISIRQHPASGSSSIEIILHRGVEAVSWNPSWSACTARHQYHLASRSPDVMTKAGPLGLKLVCFVGH
eukprot:1154586-Pelagomonas_calceolata.AAC.3